MLVLAREKEQKITIGEAGQVLTGPIVVTIADIRGNRVRVGVDCQRELAIHRAEFVQEASANAS